MVDLIHKGRKTAHLDGECILFLIGLRANHPLKIHKWLPLYYQLPKVLRELNEKKESIGFLAGHLWYGRTTLCLQYWKDFTSLRSFAQNTSAAHLPAWKEFNRRVGWFGDVGLWHETYRVANNTKEAMYINMPAFGLGEVGRIENPADDHYKKASSDLL